MAQKGKKLTDEMHASTDVQEQTDNAVSNLYSYELRALTHLGKQSSTVLKLPPRLRQAHPGAIDQKQKNRTKADVDKATNEYNRLMTQIEQLKRQKDQMMAQHDLQQEKDEADEESSAVRHISQIRTKTIAYQESKDPLDEEEEFFVVDDEDQPDAAPMEVNDMAQITGSVASKAVSCALSFMLSSELDVTSREHVSLQGGKPEPESKR